MYEKGVWKFWKNYVSAKKSQSFSLWLSWFWWNFALMFGSYKVIYIMVLRYLPNILIIILHTKTCTVHNLFWPCGARSFFNLKRSGLRLYVSLSRCNAVTAKRVDQCSWNLEWRYLLQRQNSVCVLELFDLHLFQNSDWWLLLVLKRRAVVILV